MAYSSYLQLHFNFGKFQSVFAGYWTVTAAAVGLTSVVLLNVPVQALGTISQGGFSAVFEVLDVLEAVSGVWLEQPGTSTALVALGLCLLPGAAAIGVCSATSGKARNKGVLNSQLTVSALVAALDDQPALATVRSHRISFEEDTGLQRCCSHRITVESDSEPGVVGPETLLLSLPSPPAVASPAPPVEGESAAESDTGATGTAAHRPEEVVPDDALVELAELMGDRDYFQRLVDTGALSPIPDLSSKIPHPPFFGHKDVDSQSGGDGWEPIVDECKPGQVYYKAWRRPLRNGLYMYLTRSVFEGVSAPSLRQYVLDDEYKLECDENTVETRPLVPGRDGGEFMYARMKLPRPFAARDYVYARRTWRTAEGGCCVLSHCCTHPEAPQQRGRGVRVSDYASGYLVREAASPSGFAAPSAEYVTVYFDDVKLPGRIVNMGIRRALWPTLQQFEAALRSYQATRLGEQWDAQIRQAQASLPSPRAFPLDISAEDGASVDASPRGGSSSNSARRASETLQARFRNIWYASHPLEELRAQGRAMGSRRNSFRATRASLRCAGVAADAMMEAGEVQLRRTVQGFWRLLRCNRLTRVALCLGSTRIVRGAKVAAGLMVVHTVLTSKPGEQ